jgi:hypothetical protein
MNDYDPRALADAENYLIEVLETSSPPRDAELYHITEAARDYQSTTGSWNLREADSSTVEDLLARHAK